MSKKRGRKRGGQRGKGRSVVEMDDPDLVEAEEVEDGDALSCDTNGPEDDIPAPQLRLTVSATEDVEANLPMRWCLSKGAIADLLRMDVQDPQLLIVIARESAGNGIGTRLEEVRRMLIPLDRGMDRLVFPGSGKHRVFGVVVWSNKSKCEDRWSVLHGSFLDKGNRNYREHLVNGEKFVPPSNHRLRRLDQVAELRVSVDQRFFAKDPPKWLAWWGNLWCKDKPRDQCQFRNRLLWAFGIKWLPALAWIALASLMRIFFALVLAMLGRRGINLRPIWHPFSMMFDDVESSPDFKFRDSRGYWNWTNKEGEARHILFFLTFTPYLWVVYGLVAWSVSTSEALAEVGFPVLLSAISFFLIMLFAALLFVWHLTEGARRRFSSGRPSREAMRNKRDRDQARARIATYYRTRLEPLACPEEPAAALTSARPKVALGALPPSHQTVRLRFKQLKARMCLPFQQ